MERGREIDEELIFPFVLLQILSSDTLTMQPEEVPEMRKYEWIDGKRGYAMLSRVSCLLRIFLDLIRTQNIRRIYEFLSVSYDQRLRQSLVNC